MLKKIVFSVVLNILIFNSVDAQVHEPQYLIDPTNTKLTGFGNTHYELAMVDGKLGYYSGIAGAFLFNYSFYAGIYSLSLSTRHMREDIYANNYHPTSNPMEPMYNKNRLCFTQGGLMIGYIFGYDRLIHFNSSLKVGRGSLALVDRDIDFSGMEQHHRDWIGVVTPAVDLEINITRWFKAGLGVGYRYVFGVGNETYMNVDGISKPLYDASMFSSPYLSLKLHFGVFGPKTNGANN